MVSHSEVIKNYFEASDREHYNHGSRVFFEGDTLYSYGTHFILATKCKNGHILNGDTYSNSTSTHQCRTRQHAPSDSPIIPFSAIESMIKNRTKKYYDQAKEISKIEILDVTADTFTSINYKDKNGKTQTRNVHHLGASLFKYKNKHYISSIDNSGTRNNFFICELPGKPTTVKNAYRELANNLNDDEYQQYLEGTVKRQGEYFLIPTDLKRSEIKNKKPIRYKVDLSRGRGNAHVARDYMTFGTSTYIRGTLRHREHKMVSMGNVWHRVLKNTAKRSWTASGDVD